ncbi:MAG: hypothetical protein WD600_03270 [Pseudohongiella sp.]
MKNVLIASCALVLLACVSTATAAEPISKSTLGNMGLSGMQSLSDADGMAIRGKGTFAGVWGGSTALWQGSAASNNYEAGAQWVNKDSTALGNSLSFAGVVEAIYAQDPTGSALSVQVLGAIAGGSAWASAH